MGTTSKEVGRAKHQLARAYLPVMACICIFLFPIFLLGNAYSVKCACAITQFAILLHSAISYYFGKWAKSTKLSPLCSKQILVLGKEIVLRSKEEKKMLSYLVVSGNAKRMLHIYTSGEISVSLFHLCSYYTLAS
jgi:hypothetical protein